MSVNFNGTTSKAVHTGAVGALLSGYPFTISQWVRPNTGWGTSAIALVEGIAADIALGANAVIGGIVTTANARAYATQIGGSSVNAFGAAPSTGVWQLMTVCHVSATSRKIFFGSNAVVTEGSNFPGGTISGYKSLSIGYRNIASDLPFKGDIACVGLWNMELTATEHNAMLAGAVPSTQQSANLIDYWSLLDASTLTGVNGRVLTGTNLTDGIVIGGSPAHPITEGGGGAVGLDPSVRAAAIAVQQAVMRGSFY